MRWIALGAVVATATPAAAEPRVRIEASGTCPSAGQIAGALPATVVVVDDPTAAADMAITARADIDGAAIEFRAGARREQAHVTGHDCAALAGAIAALADGWLVELTAAPPPVRDDEIPPLAAPLRLDPPADAAPRRSSPPPRWSLALGRALILEDGIELASATRVDAAWRTPWHALLVRATFDWGERATLDSTMAITTRQPWTVAASAGWRIGRGRLWTGAQLGLGLVVSRVETSDGVATTGDATRVHLQALALADAGVVLGGGVSLRLELGAAAYLSTDQYTLGGQAVGHSPYRSISATLGIDVSFDPGFGPK